MLTKSEIEEFPLADRKRVQEIEDYKFDSGLGFVCVGLGGITTLLTAVGAKALNVPTPYDDLIGYVAGYTVYCGSAAFMKLPLSQQFKIAGLTLAGSAALVTPSAMSVPYAGETMPKLTPNMMIRMDGTICAPTAFGCP